MIKIKQQIYQLLEEQKRLEIVNEDDNKVILEGLININASYKKIQLIDDFEVRIIVFKNFPNRIPIIYALDNKIPKDFQHVNADKSLCLEVNTEIKIFLIENESLIEWFKIYVVNYFYSAMFFERYKIYPFGERSHAKDGIKEFYRKILNVRNINTIINMLKFVRIGKIKGHYDCPCGSGKKIRKCHYEELKRFIQIKDSKELESDIEQLEGSRKKIIWGFSNEKIREILKI